MPGLLGTKLLLTGMLAVFLGIYSVGVTLVTGLAASLPGLTAEVLFHGSTQIVAAFPLPLQVCGLCPARIP